MSDNRATRKKIQSAVPGARPQKRDVSEDVAHAIGRRIVTGMHPPGALLPTEHELCAYLGVSRPALREGFRLLGARGMIIGRRKIGTLVRPRADWNMLDAAVLSWHLEQEPGEAYINRLFEARMVIEPAAAALAARRAGADEIDVIARAFLQMSEAQALANASPPATALGLSDDNDEVADTVAADLRFHVAVLAAGDNLFLSSFGALIGSSLLAAFRLNWHAHASAPELSLAQHAAVLDAIRAGDADRAETDMRALLDSARQDARQALARLVPWDRTETGWIKLHKHVNGEEPIPDNRKLQENVMSYATDIEADQETLQRDGVVGLKAGLSREWVARLNDDMMTAFWEAIQRPGGAVGRGPRRWYVELHPEALSGFVELATHPWITAMATATLGPNYQIVEVGFDTPFQGAKNQPWHRDFPSPAETYSERRITSLAFNVTGVDVTQDMGPFEVAPGTQWDDGRSWNHEMFPQEENWSRFAERGVRKFPQMGDISCRSALTVHRGTAHPSPIARPVLVLGFDAPGAGHAALHDMMVTRCYHDALPQPLRDRLVCRVVDTLVPITQKHDIEGLVMG